MYPRNLAAKPFSATLRFPTREKVFNRAAVVTTALPSSSHASSSSHAQPFSSSTIPSGLERSDILFGHPSGEADHAPSRSHQEHEGLTKGKNAQAVWSEAT
jgi:hypothetical protein